MSGQIEIAITGSGLEIPGWGDRPVLEVLEGPVTYGEFEPKNVLGKKGLRYKDRATLMALCAVHKALANRGLLEVEKDQRESIGVIVSSNLGIWTQSAPNPTPSGTRMWIRPAQ